MAIGKLFVCWNFGGVNVQGSLVEQPSKDL